VSNTAVFNIALDTYWWQVF